MSEPLEAGTILAASRGCPSVGVVRFGQRGGPLRMPLWQPANRLRLRKHCASHVRHALCSALPVMNTISEHKLEWAGTPSFQLAVKTYHDVSNALGLVLAPIKLVEREWLKRLDNAGAWWRERYNAMLDAVLDDDPAVCDLCGCHTTHASHRQTRAHD